MKKISGLASSYSVGCTLCVTFPVGMDLWNQLIEMWHKSIRVSPHMVHKILRYLHELRKLSAAIPNKSMGLVYLPTSKKNHKHQPNVGKYAIHGSYGIYSVLQCLLPIKFQTFLRDGPPRMMRNDFFDHFFPS